MSNSGIIVANAPVSYGAFEVTIGIDPNVPDGDDILDQVSESLCLFVDDPDRAITLLFGSQLAIAQQLREKADLRQRRPELVRHTGNEIHAQLSELLLPSKLEESRDHQSDREREDNAEHRQSRPRKSTDDETWRDVGAQ